MIRWIGLAVLFLPCVITDIRRRELPAVFILGFTLAALPVNLIFHLVEARDMIFGAVLGGLFLFTALFAKKGMGVGDGFLILCVGVFCGGSFTVPLLLFTFLLTLLLGGGYLLFSGKGLKTRLPLAPFMGLACLGQCLTLSLLPEALNAAV